MLTCSPRKMYSKMMQMNVKAMSPDQFRIATQESEVLFDFGMLLINSQIANKSGYIHEHPQSASSWRKRKIQALLESEHNNIVDFDQCWFGHKYPGKDLHIQKRTRILSNMPTVLAKFKDCFCPGDHAHGTIQGSHLGKQISAYAARYPSNMVWAIGSAVIDHIAVIKHSAPGARFCP